MSLSRRTLSLCFATVCCAAVLACGQSKMVRTTGQMRQHMINGNYDAALAALRQSKNQGFKEQDRVAYWMNEGMLLHLLGSSKESSGVLEQAERRTKELYTKRISKQI